MTDGNHALDTTLSRRGLANMMVFAADGRRQSGKMHNLMMARRARARTVWLAAALAVVLSGCNQSKRACDKLQALEVAEQGPTDGSPVMEQLQRTKHAVCVMHFDLIKKDNEAEYEAALLCTELATYTKASQCIDALTRAAASRSSAMPPVR